MTVRAGFVLSIYALVATGQLALGYAEQSVLFCTLLLTLDLVAYHQAERRRQPLGRLWTTVLIWIAVLLSPLDYVLLTGDGALTLAHLLGAIQALKLFAHKRPRDHMQLIVISLIHLGLAAVLTVDLAFSILFVVYMAVATWTLLLFLIVREIERRDPDELDRVRLGRGAATAFTAVTLTTLCLTALLFAIFPRFSAVLFRIPRRHQRKVSGFSKEIGLGDLSAIKQRGDDVMRVTVERKGIGFPARPKWRGLAYDRYDEATHAWQRTFMNGGVRAARRKYPIPGVDATKRWHLVPPAVEEQSVYTVLLAPPGVEVLFCVPEVAGIDFLSGQAAPSALVVDPAGGVLAENLPDTDVRFRVTSQTPARRALSSADRARYLPPPTAGQGAFWPRLDALATRIVEDAGVAGAPPGQQAQAIQRFLLGDRFEYSLTELETPEGEEPVLYFLLSSRRGHCELFASSFVLLVRALGIPTRLISGFQTGEWNEFGGYYLVRQLDAHAWAEVYVAERWRTFDPTPATDEVGGGWLHRVEQAMDYVKLRWMNYVISYSLSDQLSFAERARSRVQRLRTNAVSRARQLVAWVRRLGSGSWAALLGCLGALGLAAWALALWRMRGRRRRPPPASVAPPVPFYDDLVDALSRLGYRRGAAETPREFARRVAGSGHPSLRPVPDVIEAFYAVRFGQTRLPADQRRTLEASVRGVEILTAADLAAAAVAAPAPAAP